MITSLLTSLARVTVFWYVVGVVVLFVGDPAWAEAIYQRLMLYPWVPMLEMHGLGTAAAVQWRLLMYWTVPMLMLGTVSLGLGALVAEVNCQLALYKQRKNLKPTGVFWSVTVPSYSLGALPRATTPELTGQPVTLGRPGLTAGKAAHVQLNGAMKEAVKMLTPAERQLAEELLQLLLQAPGHYAGPGHGVGLLEHTLNVVTEAAAKVTPEFRMPLLASLAHDIGKLITFQPDGQGGWKRKGLHSRESARILATLPAFQDLPELHQRALLLAVKYDHAPNKMPELRGERDACTLAMRTISALAHADRKATADEKERHLERLQPEDLLWKDFVDYLREAPVVQRGKKGAANQVNNPPDSPFLFLYEAPWRDAAVRRLPAEVAAALDLTRRDAGKMAKYTRILVERLRKEGLLVETYSVTNKDGDKTELEVSDTNPLWDIQSGTGEKAVVLRGILVLKADELWRKLNYRISVKSPFPVQILAPNANADGRVNEAPRANRDEPRTPDVSDGLKLSDVASSSAMTALGLAAEGADAAASSAKPKTRTRGSFRPAPAASSTEDAIFGLKAGHDGVPGKPQTPTTPSPDRSSGTAEVQKAGSEDVSGAIVDREAQEQAELAAAMGSVPQPEAEDGSAGEDLSESIALNNALAYLSQEPETKHDAEDSSPGAQSAPESAQEMSEPAQDVAVTPAISEAISASPVRDAPAVLKDEVKQDKATAPNPMTELSRAEKREGLAIADATAVEQYPGLALGDKYYTAHSRAVQSGLKKPGSRYKGDLRDKALPLSESGPRRSRRKIT